MEECNHKWFLLSENQSRFDGYVSIVYIWKCDVCGVVGNTLTGEPPKESKEIL